MDRPGVAGGGERGGFCELVYVVITVRKYWAGGGGGGGAAGRRGLGAAAGTAYRSGGCAAAGPDRLRRAGADCVRQVGVWALLPTSPGAALPLGRRAHRPTSGSPGGRPPWPGDLPLDRPG